VADIAWNVILILIIFRSIETIKVDSCVKRHQIFLVIGFSIEFKNFNMENLDVLNNHFEADCFIYSEDFFVLFTELQLYLISHFFVKIKSDRVLI